VPFDYLIELARDDVANPAGQQSFKYGDRFVFRLNLLGLILNIFAFLCHLLQNIVYCLVLFFLDLLNNCLHHPLVRHELLNVKAI